MEGVVGVELVLVGARVLRAVSGLAVATMGAGGSSRPPETAPTPPHIPIRQHVEEALDRPGRAGNVVALHRLGDAFDELAGLGQHVTVELALLVGAKAAADPIGVRVQRQEIPAVPDWVQHQANRLGERLFLDDDVQPAQHRGGKQIPAHRVGALLSKDLLRVGEVPEAFRQLAPVSPEDHAVDDAALERRPVEQCRGKDVKRIEPPTRLAHVLNDEVSREVLLEALLVLEGIVPLRVRHGAGIEPAVEDVGDPPHRRRAGRIVWVGPGELVDVGAVQIGRPDSEVRLELVERSVYVDPRVGRVVALPHRQRSSPETIAGDAPIARPLEPLAEPAVLHVLGHPVDLLVQLDHPVTEGRYGDEPGADRPVDERCVRAPAVWVAVGVLGRLH